LAALKSKNPRALEPQDRPAAIKAGLRLDGKRGSLLTGSYSSNKTKRMSRVFGGFRLNSAAAAVTKATPVALSFAPGELRTES
jgi:hypothetical protein